jgi:hypothetical protein
VVKKIRRYGEGERATDEPQGDQRNTQTSRAVLSTRRASSVRTRMGVSPRRETTVPVLPGPQVKQRHARNEELSG